MNTTTLNNFCSSIHNKTTECKEYIYSSYDLKNHIPHAIKSDNKVAIDFTAAKNQYISQKKIINLTDYDTTEIGEFIIKSKELEANIEIQDTVLTDGYFGSVRTGILKNVKSDTIKQVAIKTLKHLNEIPEDYQVVPVDISFFNEVTSLLKLKKQDNIVQIIAASRNTTLGMYRIILELGDISLASYNDKFVSSKTNLFLTNNNLAYIIRDALYAIRACISFNIDHLDIHSGNLLIFFQQQKIKLSDFGMIAVDYNEMQSPLNMKIQILYCLCECIIANSKNNPILNEVLELTRTKVIQQLQADNQQLSEEKILYQLQMEYKDKILAYAEKQQFIEYFLCFKYYYDIINSADIEKIIELIENKFICEFLTLPCLK